MSRRFALYLAPDPDSALWQFGSRWLGYDAESGNDIAQFQLSTLGAEDLREATAHPRLYGFHLTLKAPFRLTEGASDSMLEQALDGLARRHAPFGPIELVLETRPAGAGRVFHCLVPAKRVEALHRLEADAVVSLDPLRAALTSAEIARRKPDCLSVRERTYLDTFGYPHILEAFRPHFSLTGPVSPTSPVGEALRHMLATMGQDLVLPCADVALFEQPDTHSRFHIRGRVPLGG